MNPQPDCLAAQELNRDCACVTVDHDRLAAALAAGGLDPKALLDSRPHLFSETIVYVGQACIARMAALVRAVEEVVSLPAFRQRALAQAPAAAEVPSPARGVFLGYDFHLDTAGPRLIEINTNAGGGLLNAALLRAQRVCAGCGAAPQPGAPDAAEQTFLAMFREEWRLARGDRPLKRIAIVDVAPAEQYLAPEFELFRRLFESAGITAVIADPAELVWDGEALRVQGERIDLVYNRLTDFALEQPASAALAAAWRTGGVVLTPHPRAHALYADKRNLTWLSDPVALAEMGVPEASRAVLLACIPPTVEVRAEEGERFWAERKQWFFKPAAGFGSRAAYRGDKLTRRVFEETLAGGYIAQRVVPPPERRVVGPEGARDLKFDLRCYAYAGQIQLLAARLYQGQTTNFRTPGGGFAAVMALE